MNWFEALVLGLVQGLTDAINQIKDQVPDGEEVRNIIKFLESTEKGVITKM